MGVWEGLLVETFKLTLNFIANFLIHLVICSAVLTYKLWYEENSDNDFDYNYKFDKSKLQPFIDNARKWKENDFVEEYVYLNDINLIKDYGRINKGDEIVIGRIVKELEKI